MLLIKAVHWYLPLILDNSTGLFFDPWLIGFMFCLFFCLVSLLVSNCFSAISITSSPSNLFGVRFNFIFLGHSSCLTGDFFPGSLIDFKCWLVGFNWFRARTIFLRCSVQSVDGFSWFVFVFLFWMVRSGWVDGT